MNTVTIAKFDQFSVIITVLTSLESSEEVQMVLFDIKKLRDLYHDKSTSKYFTKIEYEMCILIKSLIFLD